MISMYHVVFFGVSCAVGAYVRTIAMRAAGLLRDYMYEMYAECSAWACRGVAMQQHCIELRCVAMRCMRFARVATWL